MRLLHTADGVQHPLPPAQSLHSAHPVLSGTAFVRSGRVEPQERRHGRHIPPYQKSKHGGVEALGAFPLMRAKRASRYGGKQPLTVFKVVFSLWAPEWSISCVGHRHETGHMLMDSRGPSPLLVPSPTITAPLAFPPHQCDNTSRTGTCAWGDEGGGP